MRRLAPRQILAIKAPITSPRALTAAVTCGKRATRARWIAVANLRRPAISLTPATLPVPTTEARSSARCGCPIGADRMTILPRSICCEACYEHLPHRAQPAAANVGQSDAREGPAGAAQPERDV